MDLDLRRTKFCIIIGADFINKNCLTMLNTLGCQYLYILHDKDVNDVGELKNAHYHLIICYKDRKRAKLVLNKLSDCLKCNVTNIQIEECHNFISSVQYLIHKNNEDKYQYDPSDIVTNFTIDMLNSFLNSNLESRVDLTYSVLLDIITSCNSRIEIIQKIGIGNYQCYRQSIFDILNELEKRENRDI